jgi:uncharacterized membrane protein YdjX (TVP38/TMEM64 family)
MKTHGAIYRLVLTVALLIAIVWIAFHRGLFAPGRWEQDLRRFGRAATLVFIGLYALATVLFIPGSALTLAGGALFGPIWGTLWNLTGATLGATLAFVIARYLASGWVAHRAGGRLARLITGVEEEGWRFVAFVRLVPVFPFNLVNYAFGLTQIRLSEYVLASLVCMMPGALAYTYLGYASREAVAGSASAIRNGFIAMALLAAVAFLPRLVHRLRKAHDFIDAPELKRRLASTSQTVVIDMRGRDELDSPPGHLRRDTPQDAALARRPRMTRRKRRSRRQKRASGLPSLDARSALVRSSPQAI